jgi:hypothetical protein
MNKILAFNSKTAFILLLTATAIDPLAAYEYTEPRTYSQVNKTSIYQSVVNHLVAKGLEDQVAVDKTDALFSNLSTIHLTHLQNNTVLNLTNEQLYTALATYALFNRKIDFTSYNSLTGFIQEIKGIQLTQAERTAILETTSIIQTVS